MAVCYCSVQNVWMSILFFWTYVLVMFGKICVVVWYVVCMILCVLLPLRASVTTHSRFGYVHTHIGAEFRGQNAGRVVIDLPPIGLTLDVK